MKKLQFMLLCLLLNNTIINLAMETQTLTTEPFSSTTLPLATFFFRYQDTYKNLSKPSESKIFKEEEKHGSCRLWQTKDHKFFVQQVDSVHNIVLDKPIQIKQPDASILSSITNSSNHQQIIVTVQKYNYLILNNEPGYLLSIMPYIKVMAPSFLLKTNSSENIYQILSSGITPFEGQKITTPLSGISRGYFDHKLLVDIVDKDKNQTVCLLLSPDLYLSVQKMMEIKDSQVFAHYLSDTSDPIAIKIINSPEESKNVSQNLIPQISNKKYVPMLPPSDESMMIYQAISAEYVLGEKQSPLIKITFNIAGTKFIRFVERNRLQYQDKVCINVDDILANAHVCFSVPSIKNISDKSSLHYQAEKSSKSERKKNIMTSPAINLTKLLQNNMIISSYTITSSHAIQNMFLPTYAATFEQATYGNDHILKIKNETETLTIRLPEKDYRKKTVEENDIIIVHDKNGAECMIIKCSPAAKKQLLTSDPKPTTVSSASGQAPTIEEEKNDRPGLFPIKRIWGFCKTHKYPILGTVGLFGGILLLWHYVSSSPQTGNIS